MTTFINAQLIAHQSLRNLFRAVAQHKWIIAYAAQMTLKASLINAKIEIESLATKAHGFLWGAYTSSVKDEPIYKLIEKAQDMSQKDIENQLAKFEAMEGKNLTSPVEQLRAAPLSDKRSVLQSVHLISSPVAAAYLGVTSRSLSDFTAAHFRVVGAIYTGGYCLSIDEVFLIEQNPQWMDGALSNKDQHKKTEADGDVFDSLLYVGEEVACAFTDMTSSDLNKAISKGAQSRRPYRLAELEKIRVAKLKAQLQ